MGGKGDEESSYYRQKRYWRTRLCTFVSRADLLFLYLSTNCDKKGIMTAFRGEIIHRFDLFQGCGSSTPTEYIFLNHDHEGPTNPGKQDEDSHSIGTIGVDGSGHLFLWFLRSQQTIRCCSRPLWFRYSALPLSINSDGNIYFGAEQDVTTYIDGGYLKIYGTNQVIYVDVTTREIKYANTPPIQDVYVTWTLSGSSLVRPTRVVKSKTEPICNGNGIGADLYYTFVTTPSSPPSTTASETAAPAKTALATTVATTIAAAPAITTTEVVPTTIYCSTSSVDAAATTATHSKTTVLESVAKGTVSLLPPNLLIPAREAEPSKVFGTQLTGTVVQDIAGSDVITFVSFDIPPLSSKEVSSCHLLWTAPSKRSFPSTITGSKKVNVYALNSLIDESTLSWNNRPALGSFVGTSTLPTVSSHARACSANSERSSSLSLSARAQRTRSPGSRPGTY
ncbi:hypothetical protein V1515DRAFT_618801 [Lipomyces mesembrius]